MDTAYPNDLSQLKATLEALWTARCSFAHNHLVNHITAQTTFQAPSLLILQYQMLKRLIANYRAAVTTVLVVI
jgi:hypothetical protein